MTQTIEAAEPAAYQRRDWPLFIDDNVPQGGPDGPAHFARKVQVIHDHIRSVAGRDQITIEFADGTPGRLFDHEDEVVVYFIILGRMSSRPAFDAVIRGVGWADTLCRR